MINDFSHARARASPPDQDTVRAFHAAALSAEAGGTDNGAPGIRPQYRPTYYAAFVLDPLGNNIEALHDPALSSNPERE